MYVKERNNSFSNFQQILTVLIFYKNYEKNVIQFRIYWMGMTFYIHK